MSLSSYRYEGSGVLGIDIVASTLRVVVPSIHRRFAREVHEL